MTHSAGGRRDRSSAGLAGGLSWQLTESDVISLAINVVQNGVKYQELRPDLAHLLGDSATKPRDRGRSGNGSASDALRMMLEEVYREILRANGLGASKGQAAVLADELPEFDARDLLHAAVPRRLGVRRIISTDAGLDRLTGVEQSDPTEVEAWREHESED